MLVRLDAVSLINHILWSLGFTHPRLMTGLSSYAWAEANQANPVNLFCSCHDAIGTDPFCGGEVPPVSGGPSRPQGWIHLVISFPLFVLYKALKISARKPSIRGSVCCQTPYFQQVPYILSFKLHSNAQILLSTLRNPFPFPTGCSLKLLTPFPTCNQSTFCLCIKCPQFRRTKNS